MKKHAIFQSVALCRIALVGVLLLFSACSTNDDSIQQEEDPYAMKCPVSAVEGPDDDIVGKWQLVHVEQVFKDPQVLDYSCRNIVYHFQEGGKLTVSGDAEDTAYEEGDYQYNFKTSKLYDEIEESFTLTIGSTAIACGIKENKLVLNNSYRDGDILYFIRIE